jgi:hypothetical protein
MELSGSSDDISDIRRYFKIVTFLFPESVKFFYKTGSFLVLYKAEVEPTTFDDIYFSKFSFAALQAQALPPPSPL